MRILITGGAGFLGANLAAFLAGRHKDYHISVLDITGPGEAAENIGKAVFESPGFSYWQGDVRDENLSRNLVRNADVVLHLAAKTGVEESMDEPQSFFETNINGTFSIISAARAYPPAKFIHLSASNVYGASHTQPVTEDHPVLPREPYGGSKAGADSLVFCFTRAYRLPCLIIRPFNIYGPRQRPGSLVPQLITAAIDERPLNVPGDGAASGDWMFVEDFCRAADKIIHADFDHLAGEIINLGTGRGKSLNEIAGAILGLLGKNESLIRFTENMDAHPRHMIASAAKSELLTGWKPSDELARGLEITVNWYLENQDWWRKRKKR